MAPKYKLSYFDFTGRAELIRLIFAAAKVEYEDHRFSFEEWPSIKPNTPFGTVPLLYVPSHTNPMCESGAIIRYLAKEFGMNGSNPTQAAYIEMVHGVLSDNYSKLPFGEKDMDEKRRKTKETHEESIMPALLKMEKRFEDDINKKFLVGDKMSYADLKLVNNLLMTETVAPEFLKQIPKLNALKDKLKNLDGLKQYLAKRKPSTYYN